MPPPTNVPSRWYGRLHPELDRPGDAYGAVLRNVPPASGGRGFRGGGRGRGRGGGFEGGEEEEEAAAATASARAAAERAEPCEECGHVLRLTVPFQVL